MTAPRVEENPVSWTRQLALANEEAWLALGRIAEMMGDDQNTMIAYEKVLSHNRMNVTALSAIGCVYEKLEDYTKAADCFRGLVSLNEQNSDAWGHLGYCCLMVNDLTNAHTAYQYAMHNNPASQKDPNMWFGIGQLYERLGSLEHAQESFEAVLRFEPTYQMTLEVKARLGIIAKQRGDYDGALECLKSVLHDAQANMETTDMASDIWTQIGHVYELKSEVQLAKSSYLKVAEMNPSNARPLQQLGWLCLKHGEHPAAIDYLKKSVALDPKDGKGWYLLGRCYMVVREFEEAYDAYKHAVTTDAQNPNVWCSLGVLFYQLNQHLDALDAYSRAININPNICEVWYNVGTLYDTCGQISDARDAYQKAAELGADAQFIRERLDLLRARETGQPTMGMPGANSAPGPSEPPTTSPMPTFIARQTAPATYPPPPGSGGAPSTGRASSSPTGPGQPPMPYSVRGGNPSGERQIGSAPGSMPMGNVPEKPSIPTSSSGMPAGRPAGGMSMPRGMPADAAMRAGSMMPPRGAIGGEMPGMPHPQTSPVGQPHHSHAQAQAQAAHHAQIQAHHHAQMLAHQQAAQAAQQGYHIQQGDRRGMPGRPIKEEPKGAVRYTMEGDHSKLGPPQAQRSGSVGTKNFGPPPLGGFPGPRPQGRPRPDRFPISMADQPHPHASLPHMSMPPGRRGDARRQHSSSIQSDWRHVITSSNGSTWPRNVANRRDCGGWDPSSSITYFYRRRQMDRVGRVANLHVTKMTRLTRQLSAANEEAWLALGRIADMMGDDQNTMIAYEKVLSHNRMNATALSAIGCVYEKLEDYTKAADCFRGLVSLNEQNSDAWGHLGYCCLMMNDLTSAHTAYQYAMYNNPTSQKDPNMWYGIGQLYERLGSLEHAQESFEAVLRFEPNFNMALEVKFRLGIIAKQRGDYDGALESLKSVLHDVQSNVQTTDMASDIWTQIGHVYELKEEVQKSSLLIQLAKSSYLKVAEMNPNNAKPLQQLGWLCLKHSEHAPAIDYLKKAVALDPQDGKGWYLLGRCYMAVHEFEEAYDSYKHAVTTDPQNPNVWCSLGVLFYQLNQHLDALDAYSRAININPNICEVWYNIGTLYDTCNQTSDARDAYQKAAELGADAQFIRERLDLLRARETGQPTMGMAGANSAPGPSEPPTTSPMPTFTSRPTAESNYPAQQGAPAQGGTPSNGAPNGGPSGPGGPGGPSGPGGPGGPPMPHVVRGGKPSGEAAMGMIRGMPPNVAMNGGMMPPRGAIGGGMPGMQHSHPQASPQVQSHHSQAQAQAQAAHHAQIAQAHHHAQMQAHQAAQAAQGDRRGMPGPPPPQRLGGLNTKNLGPPPGSNGPPQGRRDRFPMPMSDQKHPHPSLPMPPGRR